MRKLLLCFFFSILLPSAFAQHLIQGRVFDAQSKKPIAGASVYINNSSSGTSTNKEGEFSLTSRNALVELIVTSVGYQKSSTQVSLPLQEKEVRIELQEQSTEIEEIVIRGSLKDGWARYGKFFEENLLGVGYFAENCTIKNKEVVKFQYSEKNKVLTAYCTAPLVIYNKDLGYELTYDLVDFSMDYKTQMFYFAGYALFKDIGKGKKKFEQNRRDAYQLSITRFAKSTYNLSWAEDGYVVRKLVKKENEVRRDAKAKYSELLNTVMKKYNGQWGRFFASQQEYTEQMVSDMRKQMSQPERISYLMDVVKPEEVVRRVDGRDDLKWISYADFLYVINPAAFEHSKRKMIQQSAYEVTELYLQRQEEGVVIDAFGSYFPSDNWVLNGHAVNFSKLAFLLPIDYVFSEGERK